MNVNIPEGYQPYLRIGTCSWKFDSWKGLFYDPSKNYKPDDYLGDYARHLNSVEIDQWFWSLFPGGIKLPEISMVKTYAGSVPDDFVFNEARYYSAGIYSLCAMGFKRLQCRNGKPSVAYLRHWILESHRFHLSRLSFWSTRFCGCTGGYSIRCS